MMKKIYESHSPCEFHHYIFYFSNVYHSWNELLLVLLLLLLLLFCKVKVIYFSSLSFIPFVCCVTSINSHGFGIFCTRPPTLNNSLTMLQNYVRLDEHVLVSSYANCASTFWLSFTVEKYHENWETHWHTHTTTTFSFVWITWNLSSNQIHQNIYEIYTQKMWTLFEKLAGNIYKCVREKMSVCAVAMLFLARLLQLHLIYMKCFVSILSCAFRFVGEMLRVHFEFWVLNVCVFVNVILKIANKRCGISHLMVV